MKKFKALILVLIAALAVAVPSEAKLRVGPRVGIDVSSLHFNKKVFDKDNRLGLTAGLQLELGLPMGLAVDGSVMYVRRSVEVGTVKANRDYIDVPLNIKWNMGLPLIGKILKPYIFTGPDFAFLASKSAITEAWKSRKVDVAWNFGIGLEFISHLQISAGYGLGITKMSSAIGFTDKPTEKISARNNNWTVTAAWLF